MEVGAVMRARSVCVVAVLAAGVGLAAHVFRDRRLNTLLRGERAARRLTEGCLSRDVQAFRRRLDGLAEQIAGPSGAGGARAGGDGVGGDGVQGGVPAGARFGFGSDLEGGR